MNEQILDKIIAELGHVLLTEGSEQFEQRATEKSTYLELDKNDLNYLKKKLHNPPEHLVETPVEQLGLGQWMAICQYVIFELLYNNGPNCVSFIEEIAFGEYDWTQATALEVLCRLTLEKKLGQETIRLINNKIGDMRYETHLYLARSLKIRGKKDNRYIEILKQIDNEDFQEALSEIE